MCPVFQCSLDVPPNICGQNSGCVQVTSPQRHVGVLSHCWFIATHVRNMQEVGIEGEPPIRMWVFWDIMLTSHSYHPHFKEAGAFFLRLMHSKKSSWAP
jgi:hypothetical protein